MTCATPVTQANVTMSGMHRFFPEKPLEFFREFGWDGQQELVDELAIVYNRPMGEQNNMKGYYILTCDLN